MGRARTMSDPTLAQDPAERFDVVHAAGSPTGRTEARAAVHRAGDWHRAVHVWVTGERDRGPLLPARQRGADKDTRPNRLDATVGGHLRAAETAAEALREVEEEVGVAVSPDALRPLGVRVSVNEREPGVV